MQFNYLYTTTHNASIDIEDIGNVCLLATNDAFLEYLLIIKTEYGETKIITQGPIIVDSNIPGAKFSITMETSNYNVGKITKVIEKFLLSNIISQVQIIELDEAKTKLKHLVDYI